MPRNTVAGGGSHVGNPDVPLNPDAERAIAEGRTPDVVKSAFIGTEVTEESYDDAMTRHGTDDYTAEDKMTVDNYRRQRADAERAAAEERDGEAPGARGRDAEQDDADDDNEGGARSAGNNSPRSTAKQAKSGATAKQDRRSTAPTTVTNSSETRTGNSNASSTGGSGTADR